MDNYLSHKPSHQRNDCHCRNHRQSHHKVHQQYNNHCQRQHNGVQKLAVLSCSSRRSLPMGNCLSHRPSLLHSDCHCRSHHRRSHMGCQLCNNRCQFPCIVSQLSCRFFHLL